MTSRAGGCKLMSRYRGFGSSLSTSKGTLESSVLCLLVVFSTFHAQLPLQVEV